VAAEAPERITRLTVDPRYGLLEHQALRLGLALYDDLKRARAAARILRALWRVFKERDASLAEINPLATNPAGELVALDAKLVIDDNALFRQPELAELRDLASEDPAEVRARTAGLSYVKLDGNIGCIVNGAGLAMATMDLIQYYGGQPANFLDIGGSSKPEKVVGAMRILLSDPHVEAVLFNIFGGITRCDDVANGLVSALRQIEVDVPIAIRLTGTNEEEGLAILRSVDLPATNSMDEVVQQAIALARGRREEPAGSRGPLEAAPRRPSARRAPGEGVGR
jgi:succinyl-CoA synthetase beta subunit